MPIYEYECMECGQYLESIQKMSDPPLKTCPACGKDSLKKLISAAGFRLKGGGWYETDFKSKSKRNLHQDAGSDSKSSAGSGSGSGSATTGTGKDTG